jgi:hypothetical protein
MLRACPPTTNSARIQACIVTKLEMGQIRCCTWSTAGLVNYFKTAWDRWPNRGLGQADRNESWHLVRNRCHAATRQICNEALYTWTPTTTVRLDRTSLDMHTHLERRLYRH